MVMDLVFSLRDGIHSEFDAYGMECIFLIRWSASLPMPQISYENEESVLSFEHQDMINAQELNSLRKDEKMDLKDFVVPNEDRLPFTKQRLYSLCMTCSNPTNKYHLSKSNSQNEGGKS
jgi:hypothetical protein